MSVIYSLLSNDAAVTAIVSTRIYPNAAPQGVDGDYIVYHRIDANPSDTKQSTSMLDAERWQVDGYCQYDDDRDALEEAIRAALDYKQGLIAGENVDQIRFRDWNTGFPNDGEMFRTSADYLIRKHRS